MQTMQVKNFLKLPVHYFHMLFSPLNPEQIGWLVWQALYY